MPNSTCNTRFHWWMPTIIVVVGTILRGIYFVEITKTPEFSHPLYDPEYNAYWARGLVTGDWTVPAGMPDPEIRSTPHGRPPGYPWFLAAIYKLFGVNDYAPRIVQMFLGVCNALLLFILGKRVFGVITGFIAGLFASTYWVFPYFEGILSYPSVVIFIVLVVFLIISRWQQSKRLWLLFVVGIGLGVFALFRPNGLLVLPVLIAWIGWECWKNRLSFKHHVLCYAVLIIGCILTLMPAFVRNYAVARDFVFISSYGGINFYVGNHLEASLVEPRIPELMELAGIENWSCFDYPAIVRGLAAHQGCQQISFSEANRYFYRKAFEAIRMHPITFISNMVKKALLFFGPEEITNDTVIKYDKQFSPLLHWLPGFPWFMGLFIYGVFIFTRTCLSNGKTNASGPVSLAILLLLVITFYSLSVILYFVAGRYRVPIIPLMLLFCAHGLMYFVSLVRKRRLYLIALHGTLIIILLFIAHQKWVPYEASEGTWHLRRAMAFVAQGDTTAAEKEYRLALDHGADASIVYANLGRIQFMRGDIEEGLTYYFKGIECNPDNAVLRNNLGYELYKLGRLEEATDHLSKAIQINPRFSLAHINLGFVFEAQGNIDSALHHFYKASELNPKDANAYYNTGRMLFLKSQLQEAISLYEKTLELQPNHGQALNNMGYCYYVSGNLAEAIQWYRRAIQADPNFLLAYNNLGNALREQGNLEEAKTVFLTALEQDPDNGYVLYNLGLCYLDEGAVTNAILYFTQATTSLPNYIPALIQLAKVHLQSGNDEEAKKILSYVQDLSPHDPELNKLLAIVPSLEFQTQQ